MHSILFRLQSINNTIHDAAEIKLNRATELKGLCLKALSTLSTLAVATHVDNIVRVMTVVLLCGLEQNSWDGAKWNYLKRCQKQIRAKCQDMVSSALVVFCDPHPCVRWTAIICIGQTCPDFGPRIQVEFNKPFVNSPFRAMNDNGNPRVQSHDAAVVIYFCIEATSQIIVFYLNRPLEKLQGLLQFPRHITQEHAVSAIAAAHTKLKLRLSSTMTGSCFILDCYYQLQRAKIIYVDSTAR